MIAVPAVLGATLLALGFLLAFRAARLGPALPGMLCGAGAVLLAWCVA